MPARHRIGRIAAVFTFVGHLVDVPPPEDGRVRDGVDLLLRLTGEREGPAVMLSALLLALGERARLERTREMAFVRVELDPEDVARLPPHAGLIRSRGRYSIPLDPRCCRSPLGFLPRPVRDALARRRPLGRLPGCLSLSAT